MNKAFFGKWKITEMEMWDTDYIDLCGSGFIQFDKDGRGEMAFGALEASLECGHGQNIVHFKFDGCDEGDEIRGEGWAELDEGRVDSLTGSIEFWNGDESEFKAQKLHSALGLQNGG